MAIIIRKFAWFPTIVNTWRRSRALVWLQFYYHKTGTDYTETGYSVTVDEKYCNKIESFSREL